MALKVEKSVRPTGRPASKGKLPDLSKFWCLGLTIDGTIRDSWKGVSRQFREAGSPQQRSNEWDLAFEYEPREGLRHSVRLCLEPEVTIKEADPTVRRVPEGRRPPPATTTSLTLVVFNNDLQYYMLQAGLYADGHVFSVVNGYSELAPYDDAHVRGWVGPWPSRRRKADAAGLRSALSTLAAVAASPVKLSVSAAFYFRLRREWVRWWSQNWPGVGPSEVTGVSLRAKEGGFDVTLRLVDEHYEEDQVDEDYDEDYDEDQVGEDYEEDQVKGLLVSLHGIKMESALDAGVLQRACEAALDSVRPFVVIMLRDEKKQPSKEGKVG